MIDIDYFKRKIDCQVNQIIKRNLCVWPYFSCKKSNAKWVLSPQKSGDGHYIHIYDLFIENKPARKDFYDIASRYLKADYIYVVEFSKILATGYNYFMIDDNPKLDTIRKLASHYKRLLAV